MVMMRIGIDAFPALETQGGIGTYVRHLVPALAALKSGDELIAYVPSSGALPTVLEGASAMHDVRYQGTRDRRAHV